MTSSRLYCCYSLNLRNYLMSRGIKYELCALNPNSHAMFWIYVRNSELDIALTDWTVGASR